MEGPTIHGRLTAWLVTLLMAGPIFVSVHFFSFPDALAGVIFFFPTAIVFACFIGPIPLGIAIVSGGWLGSYRPAFRHPIIWFAVGLVGGVALVPVVIWLVPASTHAMVAAGGASGLIARYFVRWSDPVAPSTTCP